jgi:hypothetical protein
MTGQQMGAIIRRTGMSRISVILIACLAVALVASGIAIGMSIAPDPVSNAAHVRSVAIQERDRAVAAREAAWEQGRQMGRTEAAFNTQYAKLRADAMTRSR